MKVHVHLLSQDDPVEHWDVRNTYTKDGLYCIMGRDTVVTKYPIDKIFRIVEYQDTKTHGTAPFLSNRNEITVNPQLMDTPYGP
jgi:hypothetical protein